MFCPDCNTNLDDVPGDAACPGCGGQARSAVAQAGTAGVVAMAGGLSTTITRGDHRPWTEKWLTVLNCLDKLAEAYGPAGQALGNAEVEARVETFFVECDHLRDWLDKDVAALAPATASDIEAHFLASPALCTCNAICNTHKHHTRRSGTTARIRQTSMSPAGARVSIEVDWALPSATTVDALDLANDCVKSWRSFFTTFGISEP
jgi:hypothetical protein